MSPCSYINDNVTSDLSSLLLIKRKTNGGTAAKKSKEDYTKIKPLSDENKRRPESSSQDSSSFKRPRVSLAPASSVVSASESIERMSSNVPAAPKPTEITRKVFTDDEDFLLDLSADFMEFSSSYLAMEKQNHEKQPAPVTLSSQPLEQPVMRGNSALSLFHSCSSLVDLIDVPSATAISTGSSSSGATEESHDAFTIHKMFSGSEASQSTSVKATQGDTMGTSALSTAPFLAIG